MPVPTLIFGFIVATLLGAGFHLVVGGDIRRLALFLLAGWIGFLLGHLGGVVFEVDVMNVGALRMLPALFGGFIALLFAQRVTLNRPRNRRSTMRKARS